MPICTIIGKRSPKLIDNLLSSSTSPKQNSASPVVGNGSFSRNKLRNHKPRSSGSASRNSTSSRRNCSIAQRKASQL